MPISTTIHFTLETTGEMTLKGKLPFKRVGIIGSPPLSGHLNKKENGE